MIEDPTHLLVSQAIAHANIQNHMSILKRIEVLWFPLAKDIKYES